MAAKKHMRSEAKEMIAKVYHWVKHEAEHGVENVFAVLWRTSQATGVSVNTIAKMMGEETDTIDMDSSNDTTEKVSEPPAKKRKTEECSLENIDMSGFRKTIITFQEDFNEAPTLRKLKQVLTDRMAFDGSLGALRGLLRLAGFEWSRTEDNRKTIRENHEIQMSRFRYLKQLRKYRDEGRYIVFAEETCINVDKEKIKSPVIIIFAGGNKGLIPSAVLMLKANSCGDYSHNKYKNWIAKQLLPNIPKNSVIIVGNAPYQNVLTETVPKPTSDKFEIQAWLKGKNIPFEASMQKVELYHLVLQNKDRFRRYVVEELCKSKGFDVLRLPPHHSELNPLERIWGIVKENEYEKHELQESSFTAMIKEKLEAIEANTWVNICKLVEQTEKEYMQYFEMDTDSIVYYDDSSSDESDSNELSE